MMNDNSLCERLALAHAEQNLINTNDQDGMLPAASRSHPRFVGRLGPVDGYGQFGKEYINWMRVLINHELDFFT
jgi:hypothetical protein